VDLGEDAPVQHLDMILYERLLPTLFHCAVHPLIQQESCGESIGSSANYFVSAESAQTFAHFAVGEWSRKRLRTLQAVLRVSYKLGILPRC
jgi:hypothetical protein